eukprot:Awhi_evm1s8076
MQFQKSSDQSHKRDATLAATSAITPTAAATAIIDSIQNMVNFNNKNKDSISKSRINSDNENRKENVNRYGEGLSNAIDTASPTNTHTTSTTTTTSASGSVVIDDFTFEPKRTFNNQSDGKAISSDPLPTRKEITDSVRAGNAQKQEISISDEFQTEARPRIKLQDDNSLTRITATSVTPTSDSNNFNNNNGLYNDDNSDNSNSASNDKNSDDVNDLKGEDNNNIKVETPGSESFPLQISRRQSSPSFFL